MRTVLFVDYESPSYKSTRRRLRDLGSTPDEFKSFKWLRGRPWDPAAVTVLLACCTVLDVGLVVIDSVARSMGTYGLNESSPPEYLAWHSRLVEPLLDAGITVVLIDHCGKDGKWRGATTKRDAVDAAYLAKPVTRFDRHTKGRVDLIVEKDRHGTRAEDTIAANVDFIPDDGPLDVRMSLGVPANAIESRPTTIMESISRWLEDKPEGYEFTKTDVEKAGPPIKGKAVSIRRAVDVLESEGYVVSRYDGRTLRYRRLRSFSESSRPDAVPADLVDPAVDPSLPSRPVPQSSPTRPEPSRPTRSSSSADPSPGSSPFRGGPGRDGSTDPIVLRLTTNDSPLESLS